MDLKPAYRGAPLDPAPTQTPDTTIGSLRSQIASTLAVPPTSIRLLAAGKTLTADDKTPAELSIPTGAKLVVLCTTPATISTLRAQKPDPLVRPFAAPTPRFVAAPRRTRPSQRDESYGFGRVEELPGLPERQRARAILEGLAADPGFLGAMRRRRWRVGALKEMPPDGKVGVDPVCVLGYNTNKGAEIHLRIRTDDMQGFRSMKSIRQVLAHELAHNEISEHDNSFKELMRAVEKEAAASDWMRDGGHTVADVGAAAGGRLPVGVDPLAADAGMGGSSISTPRKLGGGAADASGRSRLVAEAEKRAVDAAARKDEVAEERAASNVDEMEVDMSSLAMGAAEAEPVSLVEATPEAVPATTAEAVSKTEAASIASPSAAQSDTPKPVVEKVDPTEELMQMGFSRPLATLALRENRRDTERATNWLLSLGTNTGAAGDSSDTLTEHQRQSISHFKTTLRQFQSSDVKMEDMITALDALHLYVSNLLRNPDVTRFASINAANGAFRKRVAAVTGAVNVLQAAGFALEGTFWRFRSLDLAVLWVAKGMLQDALVGLLL